MLSQLDLNQKIFKLKPFANVVIQFGRKVAHVTMGGSFPTWSVNFFWIILEKFGQCVVIQHCAVRDPLNPSLWGCGGKSIQVGLWLQSQSRQLDFRDVKTPKRIGSTS